MKLREPHLTLDHSTHSNPGYITDCKFNLEGEYLAVGDASGDICIYSLSHDSRLECIGEYSSADTPGIAKNQHRIKALRWLNLNKHNLSILSTHDDSIKIWKICSSDIPHPESEQQIEQFWGSQQSPSKIQPKLISKIDVGCQSVNLSSGESQVLCRGKEGISVWDLEKTVQVYERKPFSGYGLPVTKRLGNETRIDYQERIEAQLNYWNSLDFVTAAKFQNQSSHVLGYSDKLGCINLLDVREKEKQEPVVKLRNGNINSVVEASLSIPSDFVILEGGLELISRDFLYVYKWDIRNTKKYLDRFSVYPSINAQICQLYQEGEIYNRFSLLSTPTGSSIFTTHFQHSFHEIDPLSRSNNRYRCSQNIKRETVSSIHPIPNLHSSKVLKCLDYNQKKDLISLGVTNSLKLLKLSS